jgi:DNA (cytosine-5)-methyltransferase 1
VSSGRQMLLVPRGYCSDCGRPKLLDVCCNAGGASMGYHRAGFCVTGVDIFDFSKRYPFRFIQADAATYIREHGHEYVVRVGSPPCQAHTLCQRIQGNQHADLIEDVRDAMLEIGGPYVIENVVGAPLIDPIMLCGAMFPELRVYRHRLFESNVPLTVPQSRPGTLGSRLAEECGWPHPYRLTKMGRPPRDGEFMHVVGNFSGVAAAREAMGIDWMVRDELRESIPPAMTEHLGLQLMTHVVAESEAAA